MRDGLLRFVCTRAGTSLLKDARTGQAVHTHTGVGLGGRPTRIATSLRHDVAAPAHAVVHWQACSRSRGRRDPRACHWQCMLITVPGRPIAAAAHLPVGLGILGCRGHVSPSHDAARARPCSFCTRSSLPRRHGLAGGDRGRRGSRLGLHWQCPSALGRWPPCGTGASERPRRGGPVGLRRRRGLELYCSRPA